MISSFVVSLVLYPSPLSLLPLPALVCAVLYVGNGFSGMGENGPKNERGSLYTYNNQKRNRGPEVPKRLNGYRTVILASNSNSNFLKEETFDKVQRGSIGVFALRLNWVPSHRCPLSYFPSFLLTAERNPGLWQGEMKLVGNPNHHYCLPE